jgi:AraC-like DNA-binding protein
MDLITILLQSAASLGIDPASVKAATGLAMDGPHDPDARIPFEQLYLLWNEMVRRSGDPDFGLHLGEAGSRLWARGLLSLVMMNCATMGNALEKMAHYHSLMTDFVRLRLLRQRGYARYIWKPVEVSVPLDRHYTETVFCGLVFPLRHLTQGQVQPVEIHFTHARPESTAEHRRIFGCPLLFGHPHNELVLRLEDLDRPILLANPQLLDALEQFAQGMLKRLYPPDTWADRVAQAVHHDLLQGEKPRLDRVASELALSPRQLQNRLKEEHTTYQAVLDQVRKETALRYLDQPAVSLCDIAFLLGFSEQSAFNHAFKRWTGKSPGEYRLDNSEHLC